jgi:hypothetical protein
MNEHRPLQLRRWQRKEKSGAAILDLIEESNPEKEKSGAAISLTLSLSSLLKGRGGTHEGLLATYFCAC